MFLSSPNGHRPHIGPRAERHPSIDGFFHCHKTKCLVYASVVDDHGLRPTCHVYDHFHHHLYRYEGIGNVRDDPDERFINTGYHIERHRESAVILNDLVLVGSKGI
jgi:hypothetical protein